MICCRKEFTLSFAAVAVVASLSIPAFSQSAVGTESRVKRAGKPSLKGHLLQKTFGESKQRQKLKSRVSESDMKNLNECQPSADRNEDEQQTDLAGRTAQESNGTNNQSGQSQNKGPNEPNGNNNQN